MIKELYNDYMEWNSEFEKEFGERTDSEIAYDIVILEELDKGSSIEQALEIAGKKYPEEALQYTDENIDYIYVHYDYLLNHEKIKRRMQEMSN